MLFHFDNEHYRMFVVLLLSISISSISLYLFCNFWHQWKQNTMPINSQVPELLSLLMLPATYQEGLLLLKSVGSYKYFVPLIQALVAKQRETGTIIKSQLEELRKALYLDMQFENEQRNFIKQSCSQYFSYMLLSWGMCWLFAHFGLRLTKLFYGLVLIMHIGGLFGLLSYLHRQNVRLEKIFSSFVPMLYQVMTSQESSIKKFTAEDKNDQEIIKLQQILQALVVKRNKFGVSINAELNLLAQEFWFKWECYWKKTKLNTERFKFALMMLIFGGAYMLILYGISLKVSSSIFG